MPVSDEDVAQRQDEILALRAERDQARIDAETAFKSRDNEITMAKWDVEEEELRREIQFYQEQASPAKVDAAVEAQVEAVQGVTPPAPPPVPSDADLNNMTKQELIDYAAAAGIPMSSSLTNAEMIATIQAGRSS